jgi:hypothetical protein
MPRLYDMFPTNYLKASDFEDGDTTLTIKRLAKETIGKGKDQKDAWVCYFREEDKGLVLNKTNSNTIAGLYGDETDDWKGKKIILYATEVQFQDRMVDAIRVRSKPPKKSPPKASRVVADYVPEEEEDKEEEDKDDEDEDDIPF